MRRLSEINAMELDTLRALCGEGELDPSVACAKVDAIGTTSLDFAVSNNRVLFDALLKQLRRGQKPEHLELINATMGHVSRDLVVSVVAESERGVLDSRLSVISNAAAHRRLAEALKRINGLAASDGLPVGDIVTEAMTVLQTFQAPAQTLRTLDSEVMGLMDEVETILHGGKRPTVETGVPGLDELIGGLPPTLTVIGSMPGVGKSALLARIIRNLADRKLKVGVFSLEDQSRWLVRRLVSEASHVPVFILQNRPLKEHQVDAFNRAAEQVHTAAQHVLVEDRKGLTAKDIATTARIMITRHGCGALFLDHLGEVRLPQRSERHDLDIIEVLQELRGIADVYRVPVVVLCHVKRRQGLDKQDIPALTDFAFSAGVERMARLAIALSHPREDVLGVHVLKQTQGKCDVSLYLDFNGPAAMARNEEASYSEGANGRANASDGGSHASKRQPWR